MVDETAADRIPAKRKLALTEDEHALVEAYRQKNLAVDAFNAGLAKAIEMIRQNPHDSINDTKLARIIERQSRTRVFPL